MALTLTGNLDGVNPPLYAPVSLCCHWIAAAVRGYCVLPTVQHIYACSDTDTPCFNQVPAELALKIVSKIKVRDVAGNLQARLFNGV